jgi:hypothetical protein
MGFKKTESVKRVFLQLRSHQKDVHTINHKKNGTLCCFQTVFFIFKDKSNTI